MAEQITKQQIEERAQRLLDNEVLACQSALVDMLIQKEADGFQFDDIQNTYPDPSDWTVEQCKAYLDDHGLNGPRNFDPDDEDDGCTEDDWRDAVRDEAEPQEPLEWWLVSRWLAEELGQIGEPIIDNDYGYWWGRTCSGQSIMLDGTLQQIAERLLSR
jgi:hypothetical protein